MLFEDILYSKGVIPEPLQRDAHSTTSRPHYRTVMSSRWRSGRRGCYRTRGKGLSAQESCLSSWAFSFLEQGIDFASEASCGLSLRGTVCCLLRALVLKLACPATDLKTAAVRLDLRFVLCPHSTKQPLSTGRFKAGANICDARLVNEGRFSLLCIIIVDVWLLHTGSRGPLQTTLQKEFY